MHTNGRDDVARALFEFLERDGLAYCVLGDARDYPASIRSDLDIAVRHESFREVPETIARFCRERDVRLVQLIRHEHTAVYFVLSWAAESGAARFLAVDVCSHYLRHGRLLLAADELLEEREPARSACGAVYCVPPAHVAFIYYLVKKVDKGELDDVHGDYLSAQWHADPARAWRHVRRFWERTEDAESIALAAGNNDWSAVRAAMPRLRRALRRAAPRTLAGLFGELRRHIARVLRPTGLTLAVLGPDGSGKSVVIERLLTDLVPAFRGTARLHLRPSLLGRPRAGVPVTDPHAKPPRGVVLSFAKLAWLLLDYTAGYAFRVRPLTVCSTLVAFDRYYQDLLIDPLRFRYGGPMALARRASRLVPGPDLWVLLDAPPEVLQARKPEMPAAESARQRRDYLRLVERFPDAAIVDASRPLDDVAADAEKAVLDLMEQRLEARHPELRGYENPLSARLLLFFCRHRVPVLSKLFRIAFNSDIYCHMRSPIRIPHPYGIVIHSRAVIGSRVTVLQQVTIGGKDPGQNLAPVIEDDVYIGAGAKVLGGIRVGRGAVIGANAVVTRDVSAGCTVVGVNRLVRRRDVDGAGDDPKAADDATPARLRLTA